MQTIELQRKVFLFLLLAVTVAFGWVLWPFYAAVFWAVILALLFSPLYRRLLARMPRRRNLAALATLLVCLVIAVLPVTLIAVSLVQEASAIFQRARTGDVGFSHYFQQVMGVLPGWAIDLLDRLGLGSVAELQDKLASGAASVSQFVATQALSVGQGTLHFFVSFGIMLYLLFFLFRDGAMLAARIRRAIPLDEGHKRALIGKFTTVIRATVKGNIVVAMVQGALGGLIFWILGVQGVVLWSVVMAFLSLLPALGTFLVWGPVAIYFLATGSVVQGLVLIAYGVFVIGLVDNILRPILVGKDTRMPDYVVLISTLGGMALFGLNGFVIGPLIAALFISAWDLFAADQAEADPEVMVEAEGISVDDAGSGTQAE
ncbi:AI-2E family transporter [Luteimonas arsenica]|uniref:AI-2E family transporter n=1 Tax=Luteimonas arsenica TaxID=1586242 RepID=UPI001056035B|nr:AI-2E family transporter [Luteimonas arsenica]